MADMRHFLIAMLLVMSLQLPAFAAQDMKFSEKSIWIQLGNQIKDVDDAMLQKICDCGISKIILLHSSINEEGYFPVLKRIVKKCHQKGVKVSLGTLVFKDTYQKPYWERHPDLRKCEKDGKLTDNKYYHYQICPNNPLNHEYMAGFLLRKAEEAGVDEIHIDYECSACYCPYCVADFEKLCGRNPRNIPADDRDWLIWRSRKARDFFEIMARKIYSSHPGFVLTATAPIIGIPGGFTAYGIDIRYEDLTQFVDEFEPMIYLSGKVQPELAGEKYSSITRRLLGKKVVPGLILNEEGTTVIKTGQRVRAEAASVYEKGARGLAIFEVRYINEELKSLLKDL